MVGEDVLLSTKHIRWKLPEGVIQKVLPRYTGPYRVVRRVGKVAFEVELPPHMKMHDVFHVSLLRKYRTDGRYQPPGPVMMVDGSEEWVVERVLGHREVKRGRGHQLWYIIKWRGHDHASNGWVRAKDAENCAALPRPAALALGRRCPACPPAVQSPAVRRHAHRQRRDVTWLRYAWEDIESSA